MRRSDVVAMLSEGAVADIRLRRGKRIRRARVEVTKPIVGAGDVVHVRTIEGLQVGRLVVRDLVEVRLVRPRSLAA